MDTEVKPCKEFLLNAMHLKKEQTIKESLDKVLITDITSIILTYHETSDDIMECLIIMRNNIQFARARQLAMIK